MMIVEYASFNCRTAIGNGVSGMYRQSSDKFVADTTDGAVVHVTKANATLCIPGAIFDIGTSNGGTQTGRRYVVSTATNASDSTILDVTLNEAVTVTTDNFWSIHGLINVADSEIGSKSGYIGTNRRCNCYYRGEVLWGNMMTYLLGMYREASTNHIWIANSAKESDDYDALNTTVHLDTGLTICETSGYPTAVAFPKTVNRRIAVSAFCTNANSSASTNPIGSYYYTTTSTGNTTVCCTDYYRYARSSPFGYSVNVSSSTKALYISVRPHLKRPDDT